MGDLLLDFFLPRTDAGAIGQVVVIVPLLALLVWRHRRSPEWRTFHLGVLTLTVGLFALRTLH